MNARIVTLDGPAAAGKSTVARLLAHRLGFLYVDSGALYRIVTWQAMEQGVDTQDADALAALVAGMRVEFPLHNGAVGYAVAGVVPGDEIRSPEVNSHVSPVSKASGVRHQVTVWLRGLAALGDLVVEGRDIGSVVFPDSPARFFLDANAEERARRRHAEDSTKGFKQTADAVLSSITNRDRIDSTRQHAPLRVPEGAVTIDTTPLSVDEVVEAILTRLPANFTPSD